jgi:glycosyltransferase involved in cell wall biosynthesis
MIILQTLASLDPSSGGPARSVPQLALALSNHELGLWCGDSNSDIQFGYTQRKYSSGESERSRAGGLPDLRGVEAGNIQLLTGSFAKVLEEWGRPDLIHDHGIWLPCHQQVAKVCRKLEIPRIMSPRGMLEPWALNHRKWKKRLAWWLYQRRDLHSVAGLHATAESEAKQLRRLGLKAPILVAANGVTIPDVLIEESRNVEKHAPLVSRANMQRTALFLSRVHPKKGLPLLVEAWVKAQPDNWKMRVVGPDEDGHLAKVKRLVEQAGLSVTWQFEDSLEGSAKWQAMAEADLFILPSYSENFGIVVAESLAAGTPVITTTGAPWKGLQERSCGWWVEPESDALTAALREATGMSVEDRKAMGERGREWVRQDFAWPGIAEKMERFYKELLKGLLKPGSIMM